MLEAGQAEYQLYATATARYPACPSAGYELLRLGRVIGPDALNPAGAAHWRQVPFGPGAGQVAWVNLNAPGLKVFSDADWPHWRGWRLVGDDPGGDVRCDSNIVGNILSSQVPGTTLGDSVMVVAALSNAKVKQQIRRLVCLFPTEWDDDGGQIDERYGWLKSLPDKSKLEEDDYQRLKAFIQKLGFWSKVKASSLPATHWHFNPREFVAHFRECGWLSLDELSQMLPRRHGTSASHLIPIQWETAKSRFTPYATQLNYAFRKYGLDSISRKTHFLAQSYTETALWQTMEEIGRANQQHRNDGTAYWPAPAMQFYQAFYGRGAMQLTWAGNYDEYGRYRALGQLDADAHYSDSRITRASNHYWADPRDNHGKIAQSPRLWHPRFDPAQISRDAYSACDSAGHYWVSKIIGHNERDISRVADRGISIAAIGRVSVLVNGGGYGFAERQGFAPFVARYLGDVTDSDQTRTFTATYAERAYAIYIDFTPQRPR